MRRQKRLLGNVFDWGAVDCVAWEITHRYDLIVIHFQLDGIISSEGHTSKKTVRFRHCSILRGQLKNVLPHIHEEWYEYRVCRVGRANLPAESRNYCFPNSFYSQVNEIAVPEVRHKKGKFYSF